MTSPSFYIRKFPWATLAVAAAVGYILVPKKKQVISPDPEMLAELVRKQQVRLDSSQAAKSSQSMLQSLAVMGLTWAVRAGMSYITERLTAAAMNKKEKPQPSEPSPVEEPWNTKR